MWCPMPNDKYTNYSNPYTPPTTSTPLRNVRPYVASQFSNGNSLTAKEREARRLQKMEKRGNLGMGLGTNTVNSSQSTFFSPQLSTDFLELPQTLEEQRELFKHYYETDEIVAQAIDLHTELPLSKVRLAAPKPLHNPDPSKFDSAADYGKYILTFYERMCKKIKLFRKLIMAVHHYWLDGTAVLFAEDSVVDVPSHIGYDEQDVVETITSDDGEVIEDTSTALVEREDREEQEQKYWQKKYSGWDKLIVLPVNRVHITSVSFSENARIELIPSDRDREIVQQAHNGDEEAEKLIADMPPEIQEHINDGKLIPMGTNPDEGSFCYLLHGRKSADDDIGVSILSRCLRTLNFREKLRQAQTQIASRAMTPKRIVWAEGISEADIEQLREQIDMALVDPDYSIVANFEIHWEEMGSKDRLLDLSSEYEQTERRLRTGLGVTESLLSGESLYSGDRLKLEVINQRYLFLREILQEYVEEYLFSPVAKRKGFVEKDKWGDEVVLYPRLSFTRLPLRDTQDTYDALFNLYIKGSIPIELILEMFNIDADDSRLKLEKDMFTVNDALFNEVLRGIYSTVANDLATGTDVKEKIAKYLGLKLNEPEADPGESRFG